MGNMDSNYFCETWLVPSIFVFCILAMADMYFLYIRMKPKSKIIQTQ